jgi:hypothetical protein
MMSKKIDASTIELTEFAPTFQRLLAEGKVEEARAFKKDAHRAINRCKKSLAIVRKFLRDNYGYK